MITQSIATRGHHLQRRERPATPPGRSCILLDCATPADPDCHRDGLRFSVIPPIDLDYAGTKIQYNTPGSCADYLEAGPEIDGKITITGLDPQAIYAFVPWAYDASGSYGKPGNVILATWPINLIDMESLELNSRALTRIWQMINLKADAVDLSGTARAMDDQLNILTMERADLRRRADLLDRKIADLWRKINGS